MEIMKIITDPTFTEANEVLDAFVKNLRQTDKIGGVVHKKAMSKEQLRKLIRQRRTWTRRQPESCTVTEDGLVLSRPLFWTTGAREATTVDPGIAFPTKKSTRG